MIELLAPAGSMDSLKAAVQNGADAVYLGVGTFNARQGAKNFSVETLGEALKYCHIRGVAVHLTLNTLLNDRELSKAAELIRFAAESGVDAFIVQDLGLVQMCRQIAPEVPVHGSTQMTVHSLSGVQFCAAMGLKRVVLSRELSRDEIAYICAHSPVEIEVFGHGALCMCYSGQCYLSAAIGGRSGNRGRCAQPCRQSYGYGHWESRYPLSLKDNCLVGHLQELQAMGVASLKLEGRMKRPEYVAAVTGVYRKALDSGTVTRDMKDTLLASFNRQGFTDGYYADKVDLKMFGVREDEPENKEWLQEMRRTYENNEGELVDISFRASIGVDGSSVTVTDPEGRSCTAQGPMPELARNIPLTGEAVAQRLSKTGGTPYRCVEVRTRVEPGLTLPASAINAMRREALNQLTALRGRRAETVIRRMKPIPAYKGPSGQPGVTFQVTSAEQITARLKNTPAAALYVPLHILAEDSDLCCELAELGTVAAVLPRIVHDGEMGRLTNAMETVRNLGIRQVLAGNLGLLIPAREMGMEIRGDFGLNLFNSASMNVARSLELQSAAVSWELSFPQIRDLSKAVPAEVMIYGRMPLMVTEHCLIRNRTGECACRKGSTKLMDKTGAEFPIIKDGNSCRSILLNGRKLSLLDRQSDLAKLGIWAARIYFTTETGRDVDRIIDDYINAAPFDPGSCTRGLYFRGVE